jgi:hypothetical protein
VSRPGGAPRVHNRIRLLPSVTGHPRDRSAPRHDPAHPEEHRDLLCCQLPHDVPVLITTAFVRLELDATWCPYAGAGGDVHAREREAVMRAQQKLNPPKNWTHTTLPSVAAAPPWLNEELGGDGGVEPPEDVVDMWRFRGSG